MITRRSSLQVISEEIRKLKALEKEKEALEKELLTQKNPLSLLTTIKINIIASAIAALIRSVRNRGAIARRRKAERIGG